MEQFEIEDVAAIYFDADAITPPDYTIGRVNINNADGRLYYRYGYRGDKSVELFNSLTTVIRKCSPMPYGLLEWYCKLGIEEATRLSNHLALYGTLLHIECGKFCSSYVYDFNKTEEVVENYLSSKDYWHSDCKEWPWRLKEDMIAWASFVHKHRVKCIAVELCLVSEKGYGTPIDIVCDIDLPVKGYFGEVYASGRNKGLPKETTQMVRKRAIINIKSGRHQFYESNGLQLMAEAQLFEENFPGQKIEAILNWAPANWESPSSDKYKIKDWTGLIDPLELEAMFMLAKVRFSDKLYSKEYMNISGQVLYGNDPTGNISMENIVDRIIRKHS